MINVEFFYPSLLNLELVDRRWDNWIFEDRIRKRKRHMLYILLRMETCEVLKNGPMEIIERV